MGVDRPFTMTDTDYYRWSLSSSFATDVREDLCQSRENAFFRWITGIRG